MALLLSAFPERSATPVGLCMGTTCRFQNSIQHGTAVGLAPAHLQALLWVSGTGSSRRVKSHLRFVCVAFARCRTPQEAAHPALRHWTGTLLRHVLGCTIAVAGGREPTGATIPHRLARSRSSTDHPRWAASSRAAPSSGTAPIMRGQSALRPVTGARCASTPLVVPLPSHTPQCTIACVPRLFTPMLPTGRRPRIAVVLCFDRFKRTSFRMCVPMSTHYGLFIAWWRMSGGRMRLCRPRFV